MAGGVVYQRLITDGRIAAAGDVVIERKNTVGRVADAVGVVLERPKTGGRVPDAGRVVIERSITSGRVAVRGVAIERSVTVGRVAVAANIVRERISTSGTIEKPIDVPVPAFQTPVVRLTSAPIPSPLLEPGMAPSVSGPTACAPGKSTKQASTSRIVVNMVF